ncbi:MAG: hypothetical protein ACLGSH_14435 [Acidobacteriota bacterium]
MLPDATRPNPSLLIIELGLAATTAAASFAWPTLGAGAFAKIEQWFARLARRRDLAVISIGLSVFVLRIALLPLLPAPLPFVPDDFSFLLAADTFAHGRLTNPTPPMWTHFESIHITMAPTYQSMYFPGQGLLLAAGQVIFHDPWIAILFSSALMCGALTWALQAWLPANWALLGGCIAVLRLGVFSYWTNTYHAGGSLAALGGALVLGALPRLVKTSRFRYGLLIGTGISILALTRPYEGVLLCLPVGVVLGRWVMKGANRPPIAVLARRAVLPLALIVCTVTALGYYDLKAFGKATTLPYTLDRQQYAIAPYYIWQNPRPEPHYRFVVMRRFYHEDELKFYLAVHTLQGFLPYSLEKVVYFFLYFAGFTLLFPLIMARRALLDRRVRFLLICILVLAGGMSIEIFYLPHYVAPFTAAFYALGLQMMRHLRLWRPEGKPVGLQIVRLTVFSCVALSALRVFARPLQIAQCEWPPAWNCVWSGPEQFGAERASIEHRLDRLPGGQLVLVHYSAKHNPFDEWVYNSADIDQSKVVWARDMDPAENEDLMKYYRNRTVWLVEPDAIPARIVPYPMPELRASKDHGSGLNGAAAAAGKVAGKENGISEELNHDQREKNRRGDAGL